MHPFRPPPRASASDGGVKITPIPNNTVTQLVNYDTVTEPTAAETTVVVIPVSSGSRRSGGEAKTSQNVGQMLGQIQDMGSRVLVHPTVSVGTTLSVVVKGDGSTEITSASPSPTATGSGGEYCKEE